MWMFRLHSWLRARCTSILVCELEGNSRRLAYESHDFKLCVIRFARGEIGKPRLNTVFPAGFVKTRVGPEVVGSVSNQLLGKLSLARTDQAPSHEESLIPVSRA